MIIEQADITKSKVECIINPSNGLGVMHKGISKVLYREGGPEVQNSAKEACFLHGLYKPGEAYMASSGFLIQRGIKSICHAVTIYRHPEKTDKEKMEEALETSILLMRENGYFSFAVPALGIEPRNISAEECALLTVNILWPYNSSFAINIIDTNKEFITSAKKYLTFLEKDEKNY